MEVSATNEGTPNRVRAVQNGVTSQQVDYQELNGRNPIYIAQLLPGVRGGGTLGDFNFASTGGMSWQINGARTWDSLVTFDGAPAVRTRANGAVIGVADVDTTQEIQVMTADYAAEYGRAAGRPDPHHHQVRHQGLSRQRLRVFPKLGAQRQYLDAQPQHHDELRLALPL